MLSDVHPEIHKGLEHGAFEARAYFEEKDAPVERSLQSMLVRYHAKLHLQEKFPQVVFDNLSLCGISLLCRNLEWRSGNISARLRLWKTTDKELPPPGDSKQKKIYYTQPQPELPFPNEATTVENKSELHFAVLWNLNSKGVLQPMWLVCPKGFNPKTGEIKVWWDVEIPDPALATTGAKHIGRRTDLEIRRKAEEAIGEE